MQSGATKRCAHFILKSFRQSSCFNLQSSTSADNFLTPGSGDSVSNLHPRHCSSAPASEEKANAQDKEVSVTFNSNGESYKVKGTIGHTLLDVVFNKNVPLDGYGACEGTLACSTCHVILKQEDYDKLEPPCDEELDMLDLAYGLTDTSRLGCQIELEKEHEGLEVEVPSGVSDARLS